jgi:hypothetical protein
MRQTTVYLVNAFPDESLRRRVRFVRFSAAVRGRPGSQVGEVLLRAVHHSVLQKSEMLQIMSQIVQQMLASYIVFYNIEIMYGTNIYTHAKSSI